MGKFRWESYSGKSMEEGSDGWDGLRRAEEYREIEEETMETDRDELEGVPADTDVDILALKEEQEKFFHSMSMSDIARDITKGIDVPTERDVKKATEIDLEEISEEGYDEFDKYMAEIE